MGSNRIEPIQHSFWSENHNSGERYDNCEAKINNPDLVRRPSLNERNESKNTLIKKARTNIEERRLYNYKASDWCYNLLCCCKLKRFSRGNYSLYNRHKLYKQGVDKFANEIDIVSFTKSLLRQLKTLVSSFTDDNEKYLSTFQHQNCLRLIDWENCKHGESNEFQIPNLISRYEVIDSYYKEIRKFFREFTTKDYRLLNGVFSNKDLKKDELDQITNKKDKIGEDMNQCDSNLPHHELDINQTMHYF